MRCLNSVTRVSTLAVGALLAAMLAHAQSPTPPTVTYRAASAPTLTYGTPVVGCAPTASPDTCGFAGTTGRGLPVFSFDFQLSNNLFGAALRCTATVTGGAALPEAGEGQNCGQTASAAFRIESVSLRLVNGAAFTVEYRCHISFVGWTNFVADGARCGTPLSAKPIEALQVRIKVRPINQNPRPGDVAQMRISADEGAAVDPFTMFFDAPILPVRQSWSVSVFSTNITPFGQAPRAKAVWSNFNFTGSCQNIPGDRQVRLAFVPLSARVSAACPDAATFDSQQRSEILFYSDISQQGRRTSVFQNQIAGTSPEIQDAKSLSVPSGRRIAIYTGGDLSGQCAAITVPTGALGTKANLVDFPAFAVPGTKVRSVILDAACGESPAVPKVILFDSANFTGAKFTVLRDIADLDAVGFGSKAVSLQFSNGLKAAALYDQPSLQGNCSTALFVNHADLNTLSIGARKARSIALGQTCNGALTGLTGQPVIADIQYAVGTTASVGCPLRYEKLLPNLNEGAGGDFIFTCVRYEGSSDRVLKELTIWQFAQDVLSQTCTPLIDGTTYKDSAGQILNLNRGVPRNEISFDSIQVLPKEITVNHLTPCPKFDTAANTPQPIRDIKIVNNPPFTFVRTFSQADQDRYFKANDHTSDSVRHIKVCPSHLPGYTPAPFNFAFAGLQTGAVDLNIGKFGANELYYCVSRSAPANPAPAGALTLAKPDLTARAGEPTSIEIKWEVPEGRVWSDIAAVDVRVGGEGDNLALWVRSDLAGKTMGIFDGSEMISVPFGARGSIQTPLAIVNLDGLAVTGSGPQGRTFTLTLPLTFKPELAGTVQKVDVQVTTADGTEQVEDAAGTITIPFGR